MFDVGDDLVEVVLRIGARGIVRLKLVFERVRLAIRIVFERFASIGLRGGTGLKAQVEPQDEIGKRYERQQNLPFGAIHIVESFAERQHFPKKQKRQDHDSHDGSQRIQRGILEGTRERIVVTRVATSRDAGGEDPQADRG